MVMTPISAQLSNVSAIKMSHLNRAGSLSIAAACAAEGRAAFCSTLSDASQAGTLFLSIGHPSRQKRQSNPVTIGAFADDIIRQAPFHSCTIANAAHSID